MQPSPNVLFVRSMKCKKYLKIITKASTFLTLEHKISIGDIKMKKWKSFVAKMKKWKSFVAKVKKWKNFVAKMKKWKSNSRTCTNFHLYVLRKII